MGQDRMTAPERMKVLGTGQHPDRVPIALFGLGFCARTVGYPVSSAYDDPEKSFRAQLWTHEMYGIDGSPEFAESMRCRQIRRSPRTARGLRRRTNRLFVAQ